VSTFGCENLTGCFNASLNHLQNHFNLFDSRLGQHQWQFRLQQLGLLVTLPVQLYRCDKRISEPGLGPLNRANTAQARTTTIDLSSMICALDVALTRHPRPLRVQTALTGRIDVGRASTRSQCVCERITLLAAAGTVCARRTHTSARPRRQLLPPYVRSFKRPGRPGSFNGVAGWLDERPRLVSAASSRKGRRVNKTEPVERDAPRDPFSHSTANWSRFGCRYWACPDDSILPSLQVVRKLQLTLMLRLRLGWIDKHCLHSGLHVRRKANEHCLWP